MWRYVIRRLLQMIPVLLMVTMLVYGLMLAIPGDPARALIGPGESLDAEQLELIRREHNLDKPMIVQYGIWLGRVLKGDLGRSTQNQRPVAAELRTRTAVTLQLGILAWVFAVLIAVPAGIVSAIYRGKTLDYIANIISIGGVAIPDFWLGIMSILLFGVILGWLPTQGYVDIFADPAEGLRHMILPVFALGITSCALIMRQSRSAMLEVLAQDYVRTARAKVCYVDIFADPAEGLRHMILPVFALGITSCALIMRQSRSAMLEVLAQDYVRTARAKGLHVQRVIWIHALRNALLPVVTVFGLQAGRIFAGAVVIETLFGIPGMGQFMVQAVFARDFMSMQGAVLVMALAVLIANLVTDLVYAWLDPRIRYE